jgi:uncharacterized phage protein gp47/JayE
MEFKTPQQIAQQYLTWLKGLKSEVNISQEDSDWWIRAQVVGGVFSGVYADQQKVSNDAFPQSARREALEKHLNLYFGSGFTPATQSVGNVTVSGVPLTTVPAATQFEYQPNGNLYVSTAVVQIGLDGTAVVPVQSVSTGQSQNLLAGAVLALPSPPAGVDSSATVISIGDGRDVESNEQATERILRQIRTPLAGGKVSDYERFALDADPSVTSANVLRYPFGFGTVGLIITAGTTDIDAAIDKGDPITLIPSEELVEKVQEYVERQNPITDCAVVIAPASVPIDVTVNVRYVSGDNSTVLSGQTLTQAQLVQREVSRAIYKTPTGGRRLGGAGYVVCSEIEEVIDAGLSANPYALGNYVEILSDRQVMDLSATGPNRLLLGNEVAVPGNITVVEI